MQALRVPPGVTYELIVVDNNSPDHTAEVVRQAAEHLPVTYLFEPQAGKCHALNTAVRHTHGEWFLFTDDDVLVDPQWLAAYAGAIERYPHAAFFGGPIRPVFEVEPPDWILEAWPTLANAFAEREFGLDEFRINADTLPYGANFAVRGDIQRALLYDTELGRVKTDLVGGEETTLCLQLLARRESAFWIPTASVDHVITVNRMTEDFMRRFFAGLARSEPDKIRRRSRGLKAVWHALRAIKYELKYVLRRNRSAPKKWVPCLAEASIRWGRLGLRSGRAPGLQWLARLCAGATRLDNQHRIAVTEKAITLGNRRLVGASQQFVTAKSAHQHQ
jgi:glycosyltransferase involved in cell wall biosynthesis